MTLEEASVLLIQAVYMVAFMYGVVLIFEAAWNLKNSQIAEGLSGILAALFLAMGPSLISFLFTVFGLPGGLDL